MSNRRIIANVFISISGGLVATMAVIFLLMLTDPVGCGSRAPLIERHPLAWVFAWPVLLMPAGGLGKVFFSNALLYAGLIYFVLHQRSRPIKLP